MKTSAPSKHTAIVNSLRQEILTGRYNDTTHFPSERMLARRFHVARATISTALAELKSAGLLSGQIGSGTYLGTSAGYIGMIIPDRDWNNFFATVAGEIECAANRQGYIVLKDDCSSKDPSARAEQMHRLANEFTRKRVRGVIFEPFDASEMSDLATNRILTELKRANIPVVLLDRDTVPHPDRSGYDLVAIDNVQAGYRLARHLIGSGARRLAFLTIPLSGSAVQERIAGFGQAVIDANLPWNDSHVLKFDATDEKAIRRLFASRNAPDAIGCRNDHVAAFLLQTLSSLKIKVPQVVRVGGFDDCNLAKMLNPPLTTVRQPAKEVAEVAFVQLLKRIEDPARSPCKILLDTTLTVRKSTQRRSRICPR